MKKTFLILFLMLFNTSIANAELIPIKFTPNQIISTHHNEIEVGDWIRFKTINDVYVDDKLYIKKNTPIIGIVDYVHDNGIFIDNAEITIKKFITKDTNNQKVTIYQTLVLNRKDYITKTFGDKMTKYVGVAFRGSEIKIEPETTVYNIFLNR